MPDGASPGPVYRGTWHKRSLGSCALPVEDLQKLFVDLSGFSKEATARHVEHRSATSDQDAQEFLRAAQERSPLLMIVSGRHGEQVMFDAAASVTHKAMPDGIEKVVYDSAFNYQFWFKELPLYRFKLTLDFTQSPFFGAPNPWEQPTANSSELEVVGPSGAWAGGVEEYVRGFVDHRKRQRAWFHSAATYTLLNWLLGLPLCFWVTYRADALMGSLLARWPTALRGALCIYLFLLAFLVVRIAIWATRWLFPLVELKNTRSAAVRSVVAFLVFGGPLAVVADFVRWLLHSP